MSRTFVIGARGSQLSLRQVDIVARALTAVRPDVEIEVRQIRTEGDRNAAPLSVIGGLGVFTKAIEDALLASECDIAVHSLKDLPPAPTPRLVIAAVPERADPRDALVTSERCPLADLPAGARIGTGSARRAVQLLAMRPDVVTAEIRGNVDTRIAKVESGEYDGAVLAMAGLERLGRASKAAHVFSIDEMTPAVGQGALAVEVREDDEDAVALVSAIDDATTRLAVELERAFLARLGAGCRMPVGAYATVAGGRIEASAVIGDSAGGVRRERLTAPCGSIDDVCAAGVELAERFVAMGVVE